MPCSASARCRAYAWPVPLRSSRGWCGHWLRACASRLVLRRCGCASRPPATQAGAVFLHHSVDGGLADAEATGEFRYGYIGLTVETCDLDLLLIRQLAQRRAALPALTSRAACSVGFADRRGGCVVRTHGHRIYLSQYEIVVSDLTRHWLGLIQLVRRRIYHDLLTSRLACERFRHGWRTKRALAKSGGCLLGCDRCMRSRALSRLRRGSVTKAAWPHANSRYAGSVATLLKRSRR